MYNMVIADTDVLATSRLSRYFPWSTLGINVFATVTSGAELERIVQENDIDIVFCNVKLNRYSGMDFAKMVYRTSMRLLVVLMSEEESVDILKQAIDYRVRGFVHKTTQMELDELLAVFRRIVQELDVFDEKEKIAASTASRSKIIYEYIYANGRVATLESTAEHFGMNPQYFSRYLKKITGENFSHILRQARMLQARNLFDCMDLHVSEVSIKVGYKNQQNFSRAFKRVWGMTPYQYKCSHVSMEYINSQIGHKAGEN